MNKKESKRIKEHFKNISNYDIQSTKMILLNIYALRIRQFLLKNGYEIVENGKEYISFCKNNCWCIDLNNDEVVLIAEQGDFLHFDIDNKTYYALFGYLFHFHQIDMNYKWVKE